MICLLGCTRLECFVSGLAGADPDGLPHVADEDLAVSDRAGAGRPCNGCGGRLDEVIRELGFEVTPDRSISERDDGADAERDRRREVLRHLEEGSIDADAAIEQLESLKHHDSLTKRKKGKV